MALGHFKSVSWVQFQHLCPTQLQINDFMKSKAFTRYPHPARIFMGQSWEDVKLGLHTSWIVTSSFIHLKMFCFCVCVLCVCVCLCVSTTTPTWKMASPLFFLSDFLICSFWVLLSALLTCFVSFFPFCFLSAIQYLQMKWPLIDVQPGGLQSRQALKDARSPSPAHIVVSNTQLGTFVMSLPSAFTTERNEAFHPSSPF